LAEVNGVEVLLENLPLRVLLVHAIREDELPDLPVQVAPVARETVLDELLGDRRAALGDLALGDVVDESPPHAVEIDTGVLPERLVLGDDDGVDEDLRDLVELSGLAVLQADLADRVPGRVEDGSRFGQLSELLHRARVAVRERDLTGAGSERGEAHAEDQATDEDEGREPREDTDGLRHGTNQDGTSGLNSGTGDPPRRLSPSASDRSPMTVVSRRYRPRR
jgi:hypothetical protein